MSRAEQANEPTMEEILASIRRIISDDDQESHAAAAAAGEGGVAAGADKAVEAPGSDMEMAEEEGAMTAGNPAEAEMAAMAAEADLDEPEVLELTEEVTEPEPAATGEAEAEIDAEAEAEYQARAEEAAADVVFLEKTEEEMDAEFNAAGAGTEAAAQAADAGRPSGGLLSSQADSSIASAFSSLENFVLSTHSRTLEDLVQDMLKPMLKEWLDTNLPPLVERLVREEIERVSRGRR